MTRSQVYKALDTEREYQEKQIENPDRPDMIQITVADGLNIIQYQLDEARKVWYQGQFPYQNTMNLLRKIAGTIVKLGERYGMPERV